MYTVSIKRRTLTGRRFVLSGVTVPADRSTTIRDQHRRILAKDKAPCHICGQAIDYELHYLEPGAYVVDHLVPLAAGGPDTLANKAAAHRSCNREKSDKQAPESRVFVTDRNW